MDGGNIPGAGIRAAGLPPALDVVTAVGSGDASSPPCGCDALVAFF
jgi:hypothetical protein